jgi:CheY-like chemotaxis protein
MWPRKREQRREVTANARGAAAAGSFDPKESAVLIVEDNPDDVILEVRALESFGIRHIFHASSAEEAIGFVEQERCDAALIDYQLPGMDGLRLVERLRERSPDTRIIIVTGISDEHIAVQAMKLGVADYVPKDELLTSGIVRSLQAALKQASILRHEQRSTAVAAGAGELEGAREEADWLLGSLGETALRDARALRLAAYEEQGRKTYPDVLGDRSPLRDLHLEDQGLSIVLETFTRYLKESFLRYPEHAREQCDTLARMLVERGSSPAHILVLYRMALGFLGLEQVEPSVNPALCLARLLADIVEQYQYRQSVLPMEKPD